MQVESGKPKWEAKVDFDSAYDALEDLIEHPEETIAQVKAPYAINGSTESVSLKPIGPIIAFIPFSTPFTSFVQIVATSILSSSPTVMMTSNHVSVIGMLFSSILEQIPALPDGALNLIIGDFKHFAKAIQDRRLKVIMYSGSREHCDAIRRDNAANQSRQLILQSGGKNSVIVDESMKIESAVNLALMGGVKSGGQLNSSTSRIFIPRSFIKEFSEAMVAAIHNLTISPTDKIVDDSSGPVMGPLYSSKAVEKFLRFQTMAKREAADTLVWGKALDCGTGGFFVSPGVHYFSEFDAKSSYQSNVFMCPDISVYSYENIDQAVEQANETNAPFVVSLLGDEEKMFPLIPKLQAPNVLINIPTVGAELMASVAGRNLAGNYRFGGFSILSLVTYPQIWQGSISEPSLLAKTAERITTLPKAL
jgi:acyl-CoA reductase-like NAD-dependent aldehyde dehydrogenase